MVKWLRNVVNIETAGVTDSEYLAMSDEDIEFYIETAILSQYPNIPSISALPREDAAIALVIAKRDLYYSLAGRYAVDVDSATNQNNELKDSQRFDHYYKLAKAAQDELDNLLADGGTGGVLTAYDTTLDRFYFTRYNYENTLPPTLVVTATSGIDYILLDWYANVNMFRSVDIYYSTENVINQYNNPVIPKDLKPNVVILDCKRNKYKLNNLQTNIKYYITVILYDLSGNRAMQQLEVTTGVA